MASYAMMGWTFDLDERRDGIIGNDRHEIVRWIDYARSISLLRASEEHYKYEV